MSANLESAQGKNSKNPEDIFDPDGNGNAIVIKDLVKQFDDIVAVDGVSLEIKKGELFSLLGPNGAGKSTTINILSGLIQPTKGTAIVGGYDIRKDLNEVKKLLGVCPQEAAVYKFLTGRENKYNLEILVTKKG